MPTVDSNALQIRSETLRRNALNACGDLEMKRFQARCGTGLVAWLRRVRTASATSNLRESALSVTCLCNSYKEHHGTRKYNPSFGPKRQAPGITESTRQQNNTKLNTHFAEVSKLWKCVSCFFADLQIPNTNPGNGLSPCTSAAHVAQYVAHSSAARFCPSMRISA